MSSTRESLFKILLEKIIQNQQDKPILVAIDGVDGSGKSLFAESFSLFLKNQGLSVIHSSVDYFHNPKEKRYVEGKSSYLSFFEDSFNYSALVEGLLAPLRNNKSGIVSTKYFDHKINSKIEDEPVKFNKSTILIFDGIFTNRDEIHHYWDESIYLDVAFNESYQRMSTRDGCSSNPKDVSNERYYKGQKIYLERCRPKERATFVIDNNNFKEPFIIQGK